MTLFPFRSTSGNKQTLPFSRVEGRCRRADELPHRLRLSLNVNSLPSTTPVYPGSSLRLSPYPFTRRRSAFVLLVRFDSLGSAGK